MITLTAVSVRLRFNAHVHDRSRILRIHPLLAYLRFPSFKTCGALIFGLPQFEKYNIIPCRLGSMLALPHYHSGS